MIKSNHLFRFLSHQVLIVHAICNCQCTLLISMYAPLPQMDDNNNNNNKQLIPCIISHCKSSYYSFQSFQNRLQQQEPRCNTLHRMEHTRIAHGTTVGLSVPFYQSCYLAHRHLLLWLTGLGWPCSTNP